KVTVPTPDRPDPTIRRVPVCRARPWLAHTFTHFTRVTLGVGVKPTPPLSAEAGPAVARATPLITTSPFAIRAAVRDGSRRTPLFLRPTGLADGLAPKERRYKVAPKCDPIRPRDSDPRPAICSSAIRSLFWFPRSPPQGGENSAGL